METEKLSYSHKRVKNTRHERALSKVKVALIIIALVTLASLTHILNQQQRAISALKEHSAFEDALISTEQQINRYQYSQNFDLVAPLQENLLATYQRIAVHFAQEQKIMFVENELSFEDFESKQRSLMREVNHSVIQDTMLQLYTLAVLPSEQAAQLLNTVFTLTPLIDAIQIQESALQNQVSTIRQQMLLVLIFSVITLALIQVMAWLFSKNQPHKPASQLHRSALRVSFADKEQHHQKEFIQLISHEFRAPISVIISALELIPNMEAQRSRLIQQAEQSSYRLLSLTNNLTELLSDNIEDDLQLQSIDLIALLDECISPFSIQVKDKKVELNMHCSHSVPHFIESDPVAITKVVTAILDNAVKFTSSGLIDVTITTLVKHQGIFLVVIISDTGIGIDDDTQMKMFDRFYRGKHATTHRYPGAGIGLSVAKRSLDKLGGSLSVNSTVGIGSEFKVHIPIKPLETPIIEVSSPSNAKFAVVDDLEISRLHLQSIITSQGFSARTFSSGAELINLHDEVLQFSAIIADLYMPGMTGLELVKTLSAIYGERVPPVVVLSATPDIANIIANSDLPIYQSFVKPIDKQRLVDTLHNLAMNKTKIMAPVTRANILVVEDEPINAEMVEHMLTCMGHAVTICYNGDDAIIRANESAYDCVLLDINLPDLSGLEVAKILRERNPDLPIIALTANAQRDDKEASLRAGMRYHLVKPITFQELKNTLKLTI
ncbi:response regulator [Alteromonas sp. McT4-15]|uniref:response regulator n=1 Tax=Alteromonas sp. McT4-15 TaxID=2881256 RepID=UPI001CF8041E|nr:response regulator [Alteromonas sp. McT4-15]MCB4437935.1 response regulator [Alteromonas sp. McT4-15]